METVFIYTVFGYPGDRSTKTMIGIISRGSAAGRLGRRETG